MKKIALSLAVVFAMGMIACGGSEKKTDDSVDTQMEELTDSNVVVETPVDSPEVGAPAEEAAPVEEATAVKEDAKKAAKSSLNDAKDKVKDAAKDVKDAAKDAAQDVKEKATEKAEQIKEAGADAAKKAVDKLKKNN